VEAEAASGTVEAKNTYFKRQLKMMLKGCQAICLGSYYPNVLKSMLHLQQIWFSSYRPLCVDEMKHFFRSMLTVGSNQYNYFNRCHARAGGSL